MKARVTELRPGLGRYRLSLLLRREEVVAADVSPQGLSLDLELDYLDLLRLVEVFLPELIGLCAELRREVHTHAGLAASDRSRG